MNFFDACFKLYKSSPSTYIDFLIKYLENELKYCDSNPNLYSETTKSHACFLLENLNKIAQNLPKDVQSYKKRDMKYNDFVEAYRLAKYQYSKYSQLKKSLTEGVYSTIVLEILKHMPNNSSALKFLDCGCGPSRTVYELSSIYKNAEFTLLDFSLINLYFAYTLISSGNKLSIPTRNFTPSNDCFLLNIAGKKQDNVNYHVFNMDEFGPEIFDTKFDVITSVHSVNLLTDPLYTIKCMVQALNPGGILVISDLLGWKENRENRRRVFSCADSMVFELEKIPNITLIHYEQGGPYCEWMNDERYDVYTNHLFILKKDI